MAESVIRDADEADIGDIVAIHEAAVCGERGHAHYSDAEIEGWARPKSAAKLSEQIAKRRFLVARQGPDSVAYAQLDLQAAVVRSVYVRPEYQRGGIGRKLLQVMVASAREAGLQRLELDASLNSVRFYEAEGFRALGEVQHRLASGVTMPCMNMALDLAVEGRRARPC